MRELQEKVIPWIRTEGVKRVAIAELPLRLPRDATAWKHPMPPLPGMRAGRPVDDKMVWPEFGMKAIRDPFLCYVLDGEADFRIAAMQSDKRAVEQGTHAATLTEGFALLFPPGAPHDDRLPHWFRPHPKQARSRILWIRATPSGAYCSICSTRDGTHQSQPFSYFMRDLELHRLLLMLIDDVSERGQASGLVGQGLLLALAIRMERSLKTKQPHVTHGPRTCDLLFGVEPIANLDEYAGEAILKRACRFIQLQLGQEISPEQIARYVFVSPRNLQRLFRAELNMPVMKYVAQSRMESAKALLSETELAIALVARAVGYPTPTNFIRAFKSHTGTTPLAYRKIVSSTKWP